MRNFEKDLGKVKWKGLSGKGLLRVYLEVGSDRTLPSMELECVHIEFDRKTLNKTRDFGRDLTELESIELVGVEAIQGFMEEVWDMLKPDKENWIMMATIKSKVRENQQVGVK
jgi:hypothetical protein